MTYFGVADRINKPDRTEEEKYDPVKEKYWKKVSPKNKILAGVAGLNKQNKTKKRKNNFKTSNERKMATENCDGLSIGQCTYYPPMIWIKKNERSWRGNGSVQESFTEFSTPRKKKE